jgi:D-lyxose ketol-isomerase
VKITPAIVHKNWGHEEIVVNERKAGYCGKIMRARPGRASRIERHRTKDETFYVLDGCVRLELFENYDVPAVPTDAIAGSLPGQGEFHGRIDLQSGQGFRIPPGVWHRFGAMDPGTRFVEFSTFHDDADTERWEPSNAC